MAGSANHPRASKQHHRQTKVKPEASTYGLFKSTFEKYCSLEFIKSVFIDPQYTSIVAAGLIIAEIFINAFIILNRSCKFQIFPCSRQMIENNYLNLKIVF